MKKLIIFGTGMLGELLADSMEQDCGRTVAAFTVDREYKTAGSFKGRPVHALDELAQVLPPEGHEVLVAVGYAECNRVRARAMAACENMGYGLASYVSPGAFVPPGFKAAKNLIIFEGAIVQRYAKLGEGTLVWPGACVCHHADIGAHVFIGPNATICGGTVIASRALIGAGSVVRDYLTVGEEAIVGAGSVLLRDLPPGALCNGGESSVMEGKAGSLNLWPPKTKRA